MTSNTDDEQRIDLTDQPRASGFRPYTDGFGRNRRTRVVTDGGETDEEWRPSCYDCGREMRRRDLNPTPVHIEHEDGSGYDVVDVPLCHGCRLERLPTHECEVCGQEYLHLDRAAECCQHRVGRPMPDGGVERPYVRELDSEWSEFPEWVEWGARHNVVGFGDVESGKGSVEWITYVTPGYLREFAELLDFAYGRVDSRGNQRESVSIGIARNEEDHIVGLVARDSRDERDALYVATRVEADDESDEPNPEIVPDGGEVTTRDPEFDPEALADPVCEFCGNPIETLDKQCPALVNGRCLP